MKKRFVLGFMMAACAAAHGQVAFNGAAEAVVEVKPDKGTGLNAVYVLSNTAGATITYTAQGAGATWQRYGNLGGGFAEDVPDVRRDGNTMTIQAPADDTGYIITDGSSQTCFWVVNYANHPWAVRGIEVLPESDCDRVALAVQGQAEPIYYYTINGRREELSRDIALEYYTLEFNRDNFEYVQTRARVNLASASGTITAPAPLCDTDFELSGDRFTEHWGRGEQVQSASYRAIAVQAETQAVQTQHEGADNEQKEEAALGGSAPCEITFTAAVTDAAIYRKWEISKSPDIDFVEMDYDQTEFTYTFTDAGTTYVRFTAANADGGCEYFGETYSVYIGESRLECPNAFSPESSPGVNDEWKVSYKSIITFDCQIFNRWGQRLAHLTHPSQGWDGKSGNKYVPAGTYFYVIKARGADGRDYNLSGDINIIGKRKSGSTGQAPDSGD